METLTAPFAWPGGKRLVAAEVWRRLGDVVSYIEPFAGSAAVALARPHVPRRELLNDADAFIANFWRALKHEPERVAFFASDIVHEADLQARHAWLVTRAKRLAENCEDADFYDVKAAGWWAWAQSCWLGDAFCSGKGPWILDGVRIVKSGEKNGGGFTRQVPTAGRGFTRQVPKDGSGFTRHEMVLEWCRKLAARLQNATVYHGDWKRALGTRLKYKSVGVFLDPPYVGMEGVYAQALPVADEVHRWCAEHGGERHLRIALCGYDIASPGEGWVAHRWKASIGFRTSGNKVSAGTSEREVVWFSPGCLS